MRDIQPIPTRYKGYHFRSRTEARWAVFFDSIAGVKWSYEEEGFTLPGGSCLPDFRIEFWSSLFGDTEVRFVEIKGKSPTEREMEMIRQLQDKAKTGCIIARGEPGSCDCFKPTVSQGLVSKRSITQDLFLHSVFEFFPDISVIQVQRAIAASRSARFEHGHHGST